MKNIMIKLIVVLFGISLYFNLSNMIQLAQIQERNQVLENQINEMNDLLEQTQNEDSCNLLNEITIVVTSTKYEVDEQYTHCTNAAYLGDALDEIKEELSIVYDPNFDKDYIYGRFVVSFYGINIDFEEFYEIKINEERSPVGIDHIIIEDGYEYSFTLVRWS